MAKYLICTQKLEITGNFCKCDGNACCRGKAVPKGVWRDESRDKMNERGAFDWILEKEKEK